MVTVAERIERIQRNVMINNASAFRTTENMEKRLAKEYRAVAKELKALMQALAQRAGSWDYAEIAKYNRYHALFTQINEVLTALGEKEIKLLTSTLAEQYVDSHLRTVYSLGQAGALVKTSYHLLNPKVVREAVNYPWSGDSFSDRIWDNKNLLLKTLRTELTQSMIRGDSMAELGRNLDSVLNGGQFNSVRLARTEVMRVTYVANNRVYEENRIQKLKYLATTSDERTCSICGKTHNKTFEMGKEPYLPRHPQCRCTYIPVIEDEEVDNQLIDEIRNDKGYQEWKAKQVKNIGTDEQEVRERTILDSNHIPIKFSDEKDGKKSTKNYFVDVGQANFKIPITSENTFLLKELAKHKSLEEFEEILYGKELEGYDISHFEKMSSNIKKQYRVLDELFKVSGYDVALNDDYAVVMENVLAKNIEKLSREEKKALNIYTGSSYRKINGHLRFGDTIDQSLMSVIMTMDKAMSQTNLEKSVLLQRGSGLNILNDTLQNMLMNDYNSLIGAIIEDKGFMSTSISASGRFDGDLLLQIKAPKGTKGAYVAPISDYESEREFLLPRGTRLQVVDIERRNDGGYRLLCDIIT